MDKKDTTNEGTRGMMEVEDKDGGEAVSSREKDRGAAFGDEARTQEEDP